VKAFPGTVETLALQLRVSPLNSEGCPYNNGGSPKDQRESLNEAMEALV
jgi:hypothetical protein